MRLSPTSHVLFVTVITGSDIADRVGSTIDQSLFHDTMLSPSSSKSSRSTLSSSAQTPRVTKMLTHLQAVRAWVSDRLARSFVLRSTDLHQTCDPLSSTV